MRQGTNLGSQIGRWIILAAVVALLGVLLLTIRPLAAQSTGNCEEVNGEQVCAFTYVEEGKGEVEDFHASPNGSGVVEWSIVTTETDETDVLSFPDHGDFSIDSKSGVLKFKSPPNFELPMDGTAVESPGAAARDNVYKVLVQAKTRSSAGLSPATNYKVTVTVSNKEEDGTATLNNLQPQVRETITASLTDPDGDETESGWKWYRSTNPKSGYTLIEGATGDAYSPVDLDVGKYLRAEVEYTDGHGPELDKVQTESMYPTRAEPVGENFSPEFQENEGDDATRIATREVDENSMPGTLVGARVFATDKNLDPLTYSLVDGTVDEAGVRDGIIAGEIDGDSTRFAIDQATGQITTKVKLDADAEADAANNCTSLNSCEVRVIARDPAGNRDQTPSLGTILVTIMINDLNEPPGGASGITATSVSLDHTEDGTTLDSNRANVEVDAVTFTAEAEEGATTWTLSGDDGSLFGFGDDTVADTATSTGTDPVTLRFKVAPNFEKPGDKNKDNVYQVTVVATDSQGAVSTKDVTITVINADDTGTLTLSHIQPEVETELTATLTDADGSRTGLEWQWYRGAMPETLTAANLAASNFPDCTLNVEACRIDGAASASYIPRGSDDPGNELDEGRTLFVVATYKDSGSMKDDLSTNVNESLQRAGESAANPVRKKVSPNIIPPVFYKDGIDTGLPAERILGNVATTYTRYVEENMDADSPVVVNPDGVTAATIVNSADDVRAYDTVTPDDDDKLQYDLGGTDKAYFKLSIVDNVPTIQTTKKLDHEASDDYRVRVMVRDPSGRAVDATVNVIIHVVDVDEAPKITGDRDIYYKETDTVPLRFSGADPDGPTLGPKAITWELSGDDDDTANFNHTQKTGPQTTLTFTKQPDFEKPADEGANNTYQVILKATVAGTTPSTCDPGESTQLDCVEQAVSIHVTDVPEAPDFKDAATTRSIAENTKLSGDQGILRKVGTAVTAVDSDDPPDVDGNTGNSLTYSLSGTDAGYFTIVPATGQILTTKLLDHEIKNSFSVVVTATDLTKRKDSINVTISVTDVVEPPTNVDLTITAQKEVLRYAESLNIAVGEYTASGVNAATARWTLEGTDAGDFMVSPSTGASVMVKFRSPPDFENGKGSEGDNNEVYKVTLKVTDPTDDTITNTREVTVTVTNAQEDGEILLSPPSPVVGSEVTATLSDEDGGITGVAWTWETSSDNSTWIAATGATDAVTTSTYTPVVDGYLRATASYTDGYGPGNSVMSMPATVAAEDTNVAPEFTSGESTTRSIDENTAAGANIGAPVAATDANIADILTYSLEGTDAASFRIDGSTGQLRTFAALDYETKDTYSVVVRASDPARESDTIDVTINVTDMVDEAPTAVETYDTDGTQGIQIDELFDAIDDYFDGMLDIDGLFEVIDAYFEG